MNRHVLRTHHFSHTHSNIHVWIQYIQLGRPCFVCLWVLRSAPICSCVCVICCRQATALKGARLQTLHWDETPATGLRPEPWRTNTRRWRGHSYHGRSSQSIITQALWHSGVFAYFRSIFPSCLSLLCPHTADIRPNWLILIAHLTVPSLQCSYCSRRGGKNLYLSSSWSLALSICCQSVTSEFSKCPGTRWLRSKCPMLKGVSVVPRLGVPNQSWLGAPYRRTDGHYYHL